eukprot:jgi/Chlat1/7223/Chrsp57S06859
MMTARHVGGVSSSLKLGQKRTQVRSVTKPMLPFRATTLRSSKRRHVMALQGPKHGAPSSDNCTVLDWGQCCKAWNGHWMNCSTTP